MQQVFKQSWGARLAIAAIVFFSLPAVSPLAAGGLQWRSPAPEEPVVQGTGTWTKRGHGGRVQFASAADPPTSNVPNQLRPATHDEPISLEGPRFAESTNLQKDNALRPMRSVVVERRVLGETPTDPSRYGSRSADRPSQNSPGTAPMATANPGMTGQLSQGNRMRTDGGSRIAQQMVDPFEEDEMISEPSAGSSTGTDPSNPPDSEEPVEPRPLDDIEDATASEAAADPSPTDMNRSRPSEPNAANEPDATDPYRDLQPKHLGDYSFADDAEQSASTCEKQLSRLKSHTLRPWRDTQKEGWEQRGDEIRDLLDIRAVGTAGSDYPFECTMGNDPYQPRMWPQITYMWKSAALCHHPLYFEDVHLERYGHSWGPYAQPIVSGAHFFVTIPILPYKMGLETPNECVYTLGHYRPGNCAPYLIDPIPVSLRAILFEGGAVVGVSAFVP
ncbi:MAG: hypothetical protein JW829_00405 [Pirellulales bacterium]|nr:hypothetical protein [Pirellulales bacterium]